MKIILIDGKEGYNFMLFIESGYTVKQIADLCEKSETGKVSIDGEDVYFDAQMIEFKDSERAFAEFIIPLFNDENRGIVIAS